MKEDVAELAKLYNDGLKVHQNYKNAYSKLVPSRHNQMPELAYRKSGGNGMFSGINLPVMVYPEPKPEHHQTAEVLEKAKTYTSKWIADVLVLLERSGKARYKLQFNDPDVRAGLRMPQENTPNEEALGEVLDDFEMRLGELRKIIIDYEQSSERSLPVPTDVEPATYDAKTRTIFFADEAIRFNKNAEYSPAICKLMFEKPDKLWQLKDFFAEWDSLYDYLPDLQKPTDWNKVYDLIKKMNTRVEDATRIPDLFKTTTKSVRLNPKYIAPTKKQPE